MPIRFRCAYCNQLMGIARRKAGTVVSCPTCQGQVVVPTPEPGMEPPLMPLPPQEPPATAGNVFDQHDFDPELFNPNPMPAHAAPLPGPAFSHPLTAPVSVPQPMQHPDVISEPFALPETPTRPQGLVLTPGKVMWLSMGAVAVGLMLFVLGFLAGKLLG
jgi:hypothetical protein